MSVMFECKGLTKRYGNKVALNHVDLSLESGRIVGLLGPNGSGKTTMLKLANGLLTPTEGGIFIDGKKPGIETKAVVSYLPDADYLLDWMNVGELLKMFRSFYDDFRYDRALKMLDELHIQLKDKLKNLSKGNKEKVQLVLAMSREAKVYFLDEPIGGVDPAARSYIMKTILTNLPEESSLLIVTHLISDIETICDEVIFVNDGSVVLHEETEALREKYGKSIDAIFREEFRC